MTSITINASTESAVLTMLASQQIRLVAALAERYGFDGEEAHGLLGEITSVVRKEVKPRKPKESKEVKEESKPKGKGKAKATKGDTTIVIDKPKKAKTGYLLFCDAARPSARQKLEASAEGEKVLAKHVVTLLASAWKDLNKEDQAMWKERAERIKTGQGDLLDELEVVLSSDEGEE